MAHECLVCGFPGLNEPPRASNGGGSFEICPSCGFQFGVSDDDAGFTFAQWRADWVSRGAPWSSPGRSKPRGWDGLAQLAGRRKSGSRKGSKSGRQAGRN